MLQWKSDEFCGNLFIPVYLRWRTLSRFDEESGFGFLEYLWYGDRLVLLYPWHTRPNRLLEVFELPLALVAIGRFVRIRKWPFSFLQLR